MTAERPNWDYWLNLAEVQLESAICLSLDNDPSILGADNGRYVPADGFAAVLEFGREFSARFNLAESHIKVGSLPARRDSSGQEEVWLVTLADLRRWSESLTVPFTFPDRFPRASVPMNATGAAPSRSSTRSENAKLRIIAAMLALLRDQDGGRFPSEAKIIETLVRKYGAADGISKRNLERVFGAAKLVVGDDLRLKV